MSRLHEQMKDYINWAIGITFTTASLVLTKDKLLGLFSTEPIRGTFSVMLLAVTGGLFFLYMKAVRTELDLIDSAFDSNEIRNISGFVLPIAIALSVVFGLLISVCSNIMLYTGIATLYSSFDLYGQATTIRNINIFIKEGLFRSPYGKAESEVLFEYYVKKPLLSKISVTLVLFCFAFVLSVVGHRESRKLLEYVAYCIVMVTIIAGEIAIYSWRNTRDKNLVEIMKTANNRVNLTAGSS